MGQGLDVAGTLAAAVVVAMIAATACAAEPEIQVLAPPGVRQALAEVVASYREPGVRVTDSYGATDALGQRAGAGMMPDVILSSDKASMDRLADQGLIREDSRVTLLGDRLVLVAAADSTLTLTLDRDLNLARALDGGRLALGRADTVTVGRHGRTALESLGAWSAVEHRLLVTESEQGTLVEVALARASLGIVSNTAAVREPRVRVVGIFPDDCYPAIAYPAALSREAAEAAMLFFSYLRSPEALAIFNRHGFQPLP